LLLLLACAYLATSVTVSGTATLPSGQVATINGSFDASENKGRTTVQAGGREFVFTPSVVTVDGTAGADLDTSVGTVAIDSRGRDVELSLNGQQIPLPPGR